jgi:AcrR family transcriptional regulator
VPTRPAPGPEPREPLSRERVLRAAVLLADEDGIESLTMRKLGLRLGVEAMSLYNHVANKDDLLDGMVDLVVSEIDLPADTSDWKAAMRARAISARAAFSPHPWASALVDSRESCGTSTG